MVLDNENLSRNDVDGSVESRKTFEIHNDHSARIGYAGDVSYSINSPNFILPSSGWLTSSIFSQLVSLTDVSYQIWVHVEGGCTWRGGHMVVGHSAHVKACQRKSI